MLLLGFLVISLIWREMGTTHHGIWRTCRIGNIKRSLTLGAAYSSKVDMSNFEKYQGLFAEQGGVDRPSNYLLGVAYHATKATTIAMD